MGHARVNRIGETVQEEKTVPPEWIVGPVSDFPG